jgi:membrane protease subunit (stomatin/prohibitin family)
MGFIQAFVGALGGTFADQWKDFYEVPLGTTGTTGVVAATKKSTNAGRGANVLGSDNIITNGSVVVVPEGWGLVTMESGAFTGFIAQAGGYQYTTTDPNAQSFFSGGGIIDSVVKATWERFKFGGIPGAQQIAFYVNLKEIPGNKFGTQAQIYYDDSYLRTQVGVLTRGAYTLRITDPLLFIKQFVPGNYLTPNAPAFDFADFENEAASQLHTDVLGSLTSAFSIYTNDVDKGNRITKIQSDSGGFGAALAQAVEADHHWQTNRGLAIVAASLAAIEYDEDTQKLLSDVRKADALGGERAGSFYQQAVARGIQGAGESEGGGGAALFGMGMGVGGIGGTAQGVAGGVVAPAAAPAAAPAPAPAAPEPAPKFDPQTGEPIAPPAAPAAPAAGEDPYEKLTKLKGLLDSGVITQEDFDASKAKLLGL